jgi:hypothetical protein
MLTEVALSRRQFITIPDLNDGDLSIAYLEGSRLCICTTGSNKVYVWEDQKWIWYKYAPKRVRFSP